MSKIKPLLIPAGMLIVGILLGTVVGWSTVKIADTGPWQLHPDFQARYVIAVADAYGANRDMETALDRLGYLCNSDGSLTAAFDAARQRAVPDSAQAANLEELSLLVPQWSASSTEVCIAGPTSAALRLLGQFLPILIVLGILGFAGYAGFSIYREGQEGGPDATDKTKPAPTTLGGSRASSKGAPTLEKAKSPAAKGAAIAATTEKTDYAKAGGDPPVVQFMTTYLEGDDLFDDSFSIETPGGEFLGETGIGISETMGIGEPKRVTAMEVWLFDKNDIRTVTKVLMSDHAFNDESLKAKMAPKGEAVLAEAGAIATLETASLRIQAKVVDLEYGSGPLPPNSFFKRVTIELAAWKRDTKSTSPSPPSSLSDTLPGLPSL
jgi:hypothetical protein